MLPDALAGLAAAILFVTAGWPLAAASSLRRAPWPARLGWSYLLGLAWTAGSVFILAHAAGVTVSRGAFVAVASLPGAAGALVLVWRRRRGGSTEVTWRRRAPRWIAACAAVAAWTALGVAARQIERPLADWDGRMTWAPAARWICAEQTVAPRALRESRWFVSHPDYPPLLALAQCAALTLRGEPAVSEPFRLLYALFLPALMAVAWTATRRWAGRRAAWLALAALALLPLPAWNPDGGATGAYADLALAAFFGGGFTLVHRARERGDAGAGGLLLAAAVLSKNEGLWLTLGALGAAALALVARRAGWRRRAGRWLAAALSMATAAGFLSAWRRGLAPRGDEDYAVLLAGARLAESVERLQQALPEMARQMLTLGEWSLAFWVAPALLLLGLRGWARWRHLPWIVAALSPLLVGAAAYALHPDSAALARVTWNRFLVQALVPMLVVAVLAARGALQGGAAPGSTVSAGESR